MTPDLILLNGRIRTMDAARPQAQALAIAGGRILALGTDAEILALAGPATRRLDGGGRLILPGFQDAHVHLLDGGTDLVDSVALWEVTGLADLQQALASHVARTDAPMVTGAGWQPGLFGDHNLARAGWTRRCRTGPASPTTPAITVPALTLPPVCGSGWTGTRPIRRMAISCVTLRASQPACCMKTR